METKDFCRLFRNSGICRYGKRCKFMHVVKTEPDYHCFSFLDGAPCRFGENCQYRHGETDPRFADGRRPAPRDKKIRLRDIHNKPICLQFLGGKCTYKECKYSHLPVHEKKRKNRPKPKMVETINVPEWNAYIPQQPTFYYSIPTRPICFHWKAGNCRFGSNCWYQHGPYDPRFF